MKVNATERRRDQRCLKDVGMICTLLNGSVNRRVALRNYSAGGLFFETMIPILPETYIVLRAAGANESRDIATASAAPSFSIDSGDPDVCRLFRSHTVAKVQRCQRLGGHDDSPRYGVAAEIQRWTD